MFEISAELFPTSTRTSTIGVCSAVARAAELANIWPQFPHVILAALPLLGGLLAITLPETKDAGLPETMKQAREL